jgi:hypothetical protein
VFANEDHLGPPPMPWNHHGFFFRLRCFIHSPRPSSVCASLRILPRPQACCLAYTHRCGVHRAGGKGYGIRDGVSR